MSHVHVASRQHPFVKKCRQVATGRGEPGTVLLDGEHLVAEALAAGVPIEGVLTDGRPRDVLRDAAARGVPILEAPRAIVNAASPVRTPSGIVALARWAPASVDTLLAVPSPLIIGLVNVQDPGNLGSVIRSADALGATGVIALDGTADPASWKALRGAMGSTFRLAVATADLAATLQAARRRSIRIAAAVASGGAILGRDAIGPPLLVLVGNEGEGLSQVVVSQADVQLTIPMRAGTNSLNVGVSAALVLWEARRGALAPR